MVKEDVRLSVDGSNGETVNPSVKYNEREADKTGLDGIEWE